MSTKKKKVLSLFLALVMVFSLLPGAALATQDDTAAATAATSTEFMRIMHLDCGRKYFTVDQVKDIIDQLAENHYTHIELAFGNEGLRLLLDENDMAVGNYTGARVLSALETGNLSYDKSQSFKSSQGAWTASEMTGLIQYANNKGIGVIPMFDAPGHMNAVIAAMQDLGISVDVFYTLPNTAPGNIGQSFDPTNAAATEFVKELMANYIKFFQENGCKYFNFAGDECGFEKMNTTQYTAYAELINSLAATVRDAGMTPMMFNDGVYYKGRTTNTAFDTDIVICYWDASTNKYASASDLASKGFNIINTNNKWYYVAGNESSDWWGFSWAKSNMSGAYKDCTAVDGGYQTNVGCMAAFWCDNPQNDVNYSNLYDWIATLATNNPNYFKKAATPVDPTPVITAPSSISLDNTNGVTLTSSIPATWSSNNEDVIRLVPPTNDVYGESVLAIPVSAGTATITAMTEAKQSAEVTIKVLEAGAVEVTDERTITVTAGDTATDTISGNNYAGEYTTADPDVATVSVTGTDATAGTIDYSSTRVSYSSLTNGNTSWTKTNYYHKVGSDYYPIYAYQQRSGRTIYYYYGYSTTDSANSVQTIGSSTSQNNHVTVYTQSGTPAQPASTTVTFNGLKVGTTTVTVGHVKYTINVVAENLNVDPLPIQLWITNYAIETENAATGDYWAASWNPSSTNHRRAYYVNVSASSAYGANGAAISEVLPVSTTGYEHGGTYWVDNRYDSTKVAKKLVLWSGRVHGTSNMQKIYGTDYSNTGTEFQYIRYYGQKWEVSNDRTEWTEVQGTNSLSSEQLVAYYMIRSEITNEVTTDVADWGSQQGETAYTNQVKNTSQYFVLLDFAVKYQDGTTRVPDSFPQENKTFAFHCTPDDAATGKDSSGNTYRMLNNFRAVNSPEYEVYMVTVTMTDDAVDNTLSATDANSANGYEYKGEEQILWAIDEATKDNSRLDAYEAISGSSTYSGCTIGGDPYIRGVEVYSQHGALITYYVRAKVTEDSLMVYYVDQTTGVTFHDYGIIVNSGTLFKENIKLNEKTWKGPLDNGAVTNSLGVVQTVSADLSTMIKVPAQYRYAVDYKCVDVQRKKEGKEVWLYYTFKSDKSFVVDYGLPLTIKPTDISSTLGNATLDSVTVTGNQYADIAYDAKTKNFTYTLNQMMKGVDQLKVKYTGSIPKGDGTQSGEVEYTINIIPASTMYYEENFVTFNDGNSIGDNVKWTDAAGTTPTNVTQALETLGDRKNPYGSDPDAYNSMTAYSLNTAKQMTVTPSMVNSWNNDSSSWPTAQFTFKGTGFDVISLTNNKSGAIFVDVYKGTSITPANREYSYIVDNYYGYKQNDNGEWVVDEKNTNTLYQIPVMKISGLDYGEYTAVITVFYDGLFSHTNDTNSNGYSFWLDAIRIYDPMGEYADYTQDNEGYPQYFNFHDLLVKDTTNDRVVFIDGDANATISEYTTYGPNNEVYLANGQAIAFTVPADVTINQIQVGAKALNGSANLVVGTTTVKENLTSTTDMYYDITNNVTQGQPVTITNNGTGTLSLTNLKITHTSNATTTLATLTDADQDAALKVVRSVFAAEAPVIEPFVPERFEAKWDRSVRAGQRATLTVKTSEDVAAISVDGQVIDSYRTYTERSGWGWNAARVTYRVFTYTVTPTETTDYTVAALNSDGVASTPITATLTVTTQRPGGWWGNGWWY